LEIGIPENKLNKAHSTHRKRAFSLIEVLLVLALVAVLVGIVAGNAGSFIVGANFEPPDRVLKKAVLDAVYHASESKRATFLHYSEDTASFYVLDSTGQSLSEWPVYKVLSDKIKENPKLIPSVIFRALGPLAGVEGGPSSSVYNENELVIEKIPFHYGSILPFSAQIYFKDKKDDFSFDPFSGYLLKKEE